ncbi:recombinase family protein [Streptomyces sp. NPDC087850]|uniref:recombinase family protein n=1 Tax=Streptomyces sp. NPDC087850 TaxID=3365809 RepID=UPI0038011A5A
MPSTIAARPKARVVVPTTFASEAALRTKVKRVAIYLRVSTKDQLLGYGLDVQLKGVMDYLERKKVLEPDTIYEIVDIYEDAGESGAKQDRPQILRLERDVQAGKIDVVATHKFDRIGRTGRAFWHWVWTLEDAGVSIISVTQEIDTTTTHGTVALQNLASFSEMEWRTILERTQNGINMKAAAGGWTGGPPPYGFYIEDKGSRNSRLAICEREFKTLEYAAMFLVEGGCTVDRAAHLLNLMGRYTRKGMEWTGANLRHKFFNTALDGFVVFRNTDEVINKRRRRATKLDEHGNPKHGPTVIIDTPMPFELDRLMSVRLALKRNGWRMEGPYKHHPLSTRITGTCGKHYTGVYVKAEDRRTYRCGGKKNCEDSIIDAVTIERTVWQSLRHFFGDKEKLRELARGWAGTSPDHRHVYKSRIEELTAEVSTIKTLVTTQLVEFAKAGVDPTAVAAATATLNEDIAKKEALIADARSMLEEAEASSRRSADFTKLVEIASFNLDNLSSRQKVEVLDLLDIRVVLKGAVPLNGRFGPDAAIESWFQARNVQPRELTDELWEEVLLRIPPTRVTKRTYDLRKLVEGLIYKVRNGCGWHGLPEGYPPREALRSRFRDWSKKGVWDDIMEPLLEPATGSSSAPLPPMEVSGNIDPRIVTLASTEDGRDLQVAHLPALIPG